MNALPSMRPAQCEGKKPYPTWRAARDQQRHSHKCRIYRCPHCGNFHLGTRMKGEKHGRPKPPPPSIELEY